MNVQTKYQQQSKAILWRGKIKYSVFALCKLVINLVQVVIHSLQGTVLVSWSLNTV